MLDFVHSGFGESLTAVSIMRPSWVPEPLVQAISSPVFLDPFGDPHSP